MNPKRYAMIMAVVVCALLFGGCQRANTAAVSQNTRTAADIRKAELLRELDRKWENPDAHFELGQLYHATGDWSKAEWHYNIALGFNPARRDVQAAVVKLQFDKGDRSRGEWAANTYISQVASSPDQLLALGAAFEKQGLDDYALKCYQDALKMAPDSSTVNRQLGYYYLAKGKKDLAKEYLTRSFQLNPNQPDVAGELGRLGVVIKIPQASEPSSENLGQAAKPASQPK
jgi:tetratricopeptide (TPR) repeat protein